MVRARVTGGATAALGMAAALAAACLAGAPLWASASASQAVQDQLAGTCSTDASLRLPVYQGPANEGRISAIGARVPHVQPPLRLLGSMVHRPGYDDRLGRFTLLSRTGMEQHVEPPLTPLAEGEMAVSRGNLAQLGVSIGDVVRLSGAGGLVDLRVTQVFDDIPVRPEPEFWCGYDDLFRPDGHGNPPLPWGLVAEATHGRFVDPSLARLGPFPVLEYRTVDRPLTMHESRELLAGHQRAFEEYSDATGLEGARLPAGELPRLVARAEAIGTAVSRAIAPVRLAGVTAAAVVGLAAAAMLAVERRRELRLRAIRGERPVRVWASLLVATAVPITFGSLIGAAVAFVGVRTGGPTSEVERDAVLAAIRAVVVATVVGTVGTAAVAAFVGDRTVDAHPGRRRWRAWVPVELVPVALAVVSFRRLDEVGGLRLFGLDVRGGELLAQAFPLFAVVAVAAVAIRPVRWASTRWRTAGGRLPQGVRLGWRRAVFQPGVTATLVASSALAVSCLVVSFALVESATHQLDAKAQTFVGTDLVVTLYDEPAVPDALAGRATVVQRLQGQVEDGAIDVLGVDRATFASVAAASANGSGASYAELMAMLAPPAGDGPLPAVVAGLGSDELDVVVRRLGGSVAVELVVAHRADHLPGFQNGRVLALVDREALVEQVSGTRSLLWVRDPPDDAVALAGEASGRVGPVLDARQVFASSSYSAQRWSYTPLGVLGALLGAVVVTMQLLVVEARRSGRRSAQVVLRATGFGRRSTWAAAGVEIGVPVTVGTGVGLGAGLLAARLAVPRLDTLPLLSPVARLALPAGAVAWMLAAVAVSVAALAGLCVRSSLAGDPMEVLRGTP